MFGKLAQFFARARNYHAAARVYQRTLCVRYYFRRLFGVTVGREFARLSFYLRRGSKLVNRLLYVFGNVYQHRSGSAAQGDFERFAYRVGKLAHVGNYKVVLCNGHCNALYVNLLKAVFSKRRNGHVARYGNERHAVHICGCYARNEVCRARTGGRHHNACLARCSRVAVGGVARALFVTGENLLYFVAVEVERVERVYNISAGISEYVRNALFYERFGYYFRSAQSFCCALLHVVR